MENLSRKLEGELILDLEDEEALEGEEDGQLKLLGKIISDRPVNFVAVKGFIYKLWSPLKGMKIVDMVNNIWMFTFNCSMDKTKVVENNPWSFMGHLIALAEWDPDLTPEEVEFNNMDIWVQIHGLQMGYMKKEKAESTAAVVGKVSGTYEPGDNSQCGKFMRVRVRFSLQKPLVKGVYL